MSDKPQKEAAVEVEPLIDADSKAALDEIEQDSLDLKLTDLTDRIKKNREIAFSGDVTEEAAARFLSLPKIVNQHSKTLGLSPDGFARAAANQGLDLGELVQKVGREGRDASEVLKGLEAGGMVALKPVDQRKKAMKDLQHKRIVAKRGGQIKQRAIQRIRSGEKKFKFTDEELASVGQREPIDFSTITDPTERQSAVAKVVLDMGVESGLSENQMIAILANGLAESKLDPMALNKRGEDSHGVWQFNRNKGEGKGFTVDQLQNPEFQMERIIRAIKSRGELSDFRKSDADVNELTKQFMVHFEKPKDQSEAKIKERQNFQKQARRLLDAASKLPSKPSSLAELDRKKRMEVLKTLTIDRKRDYELRSDKEAIGGDVRNEIAQPGSAEHNGLLQFGEELYNPQNSSDPERAALIRDVLAKLADTSDSSAMSGQAFQRVMSTGIQYDTARAAKKLGMSVAEFTAAAKQPNSRERAITDHIVKANKRHVALYLTVGKLNSPAFMSYEFMDPDNYMGERRVGEDDSYLEQLFDAVGKNRVELVGLKNGLPIYRAQGNFDAIANKIDTIASIGAGGLRRLLDGPEAESFMEALEKGTIEGAKTQDNFIQVMLSREGAQDGGAKAFAYGSLGFLMDVITPDPTFGLAKIAQSTRKAVKGMTPLLNKRYLPETFDQMSVAATNMIEAQKLTTRAADSFAAGNLQEGMNLLAQAKKAVQPAEQAEKAVRSRFKEVMRQVDRTDGRLGREMSRDQPLLTGRDGIDDKVAESLGFSDFGIKRDFMHPAFERVKSRDGADQQLVAFPEFLSLIRKLDRLTTLADRIARNDTAGGYAIDVTRKVLAPMRDDISKQLKAQGFGRVPKKGQSEEARLATMDILDFMTSRQAADLLVNDAAGFQATLLDKLKKLPKPNSDAPDFDMSKLDKAITKARKDAVVIAAKKKEAIEAADLKKLLPDVTRSLAAIAESRGASNALVRKALADDYGYEVAPVIQSVANRFEEIGRDKISSVALQFRDDIEKAFPALKGNAAMHIARNLDERLKAIAKTTNESVDEIYETREFKDIVGRFKRDELERIEQMTKQPPEGITARVISSKATAPEVGIDPKIQKIDERLELITTKELRDRGDQADTDMLRGLSFITVETDVPRLVVQSVEVPSELRGKGIATEMYLELIREAKKRGVGISSGVNPSPEATRIYQRLIDAGIPIERFEVPPDPDGLVRVFFGARPEDIAKVSDESLDLARFAPKPASTTDVNVSEFAQDVQTFVRAAEEAPTIDAFVLEIAKVARKELDSTQMSAVTKWLASKGIRVGHRGAVFTADDPQVIEQAEQAFAEAFTAYAKGAPPPTPDTTSAFERVRDRLVSSFAAAKNASVADGADFNPSKQVEEVFDNLLRGQAPRELGAPTILKMIRRTFLDDLPNKIGDDYLMTIARESDRLGHPISVAELKAKLKQAHKQYLKDPDADITIDLPGPVSLGGGLLAPPTKASYSLDEIGQGFTSYAQRKTFTENPATRKMALDSRIETVKELSPTQMIDRYVTDSNSVAKFAKATIMGGDAVFDMRALPPEIRKNVMSGVRMTQQSIGDTVKLISEGDASKLIRFITGDPLIRFKSGRNALSAGHDMMASAADSLTTYFNNVKDNPATAKQFDTLMDILSDQKFLNKAELDGRQEEVLKALRTVALPEGAGSDLLRNIFKAFRVDDAQKLDQQSFAQLEAITYHLGLTTRKGEVYGGINDSQRQFRDLYNNIDELATDEIGPVANRVTALIAGYGQAAKARLEWVKLGIATDANTAKNFKKWMIGEGLDNPEDLAKVQQVFRVHGYDPRFMEIADLDDLNLFVPAAAREKLAMALEQATDPTLTALTGDMFEAIGKGMKEANSTSDLAMAWTYRYMKTRMVRGHYILKTRYFLMNTFDHYNQMAQIVGFRPALISTTRVAFQTLSANPLAQVAIAATQRFGPDEAGEAVREALQKAGDEGAQWASKLLMASKWRGDLNAVLDGRKGFVMVNGVPVSNRDIRRIGVEEGLSSSFDTAELGIKIRRAGSMFLEDQVKQYGDSAAAQAGFAIQKAGDVARGTASVFKDLAKVSEDIAEGWSERERYGAMLTLIEMGVEPRKAARLVIDALYDYAGSMSKGDRNWLVQMIFPFWAFQKNANRQLIDVVFSPRGAYRLGVLNRSYRRGTELISELIYEDFVDPLGVHVESFDAEEREAYDALKADLCNELGFDSINEIPPELKTQIRLAFSGRDSLFEHGRWYKIDTRGRKLRELFRNSKKGHSYINLMNKALIEKPDRSSLPGYDQIRDAILVPYAMNEQNKKFWGLMAQQNRNATYTSILLPEQSYKAAVKHISLVASTFLGMMNYAADAGPDYLTDAWSPDDTDELFTFSKPLFDLTSPDRALIVSDLVASASENGVPYRLSGYLAKHLDQLGYDILAVDESEDPLSKRLTYEETMKKYQDGDIKVFPEDPYLRGGVLKPDKRYYISGGIMTMLLKHSPVDELNGIMKRFEQGNIESAAGLRGELQRWARMAGVDIRDVNVDKIMKQTQYELDKEVGGDFLEVKKRQGAGYLDELIEATIEEREEEAARGPKQFKSDLERLERLKKRDTGKSVDKL